MLLALILGSLATWRLTYMLQEETGPVAIFERLRAQVNKLKRTDGGIWELMICFYCLSVWIAILLTALFFVSYVAFFIVTGILSMSAVAIFINQWHERLQ